MKRIKLFGVAMLLLLLAIFVSLPYITVYQIKNAARNHDGEALAKHVNFPSVRQGLKDQINAKFAKAVSEDASVNPFSALGAAFGGMFVDKMVDAYVTPEGLTQLMVGEKPSVNPLAKDKSNKEELFKDAIMSYDSPSQFSITTIDEESGEDVIFILKRSGLLWQLAEIKLPM